MKGDIVIHECYLIIHKSIRAIGRSIEASNVLGQGSFTQHFMDFVTQK
jgi:hypothetical protein